MTPAGRSSAHDVIRSLDLQPHPEGGWYRETFRDDEASDGRSYATAIYYLLSAGEKSAWHRVDATEIWHHYAGDELRLSMSINGTETVDHLLGPVLAADQRPQIVVPAQIWQSAETLGSWTLVGCTVAPGFLFDGFELAPPGFGPTPAQRDRQA